MLFIKYIFSVAMVNTIWKIDTLQKTALNNMMHNQKEISYVEHLTTVCHDTVCTL